MLTYKKAYFSIGFFLISTLLLLGQNQKIADSAISVYESRKFDGSELDLLKTIAAHENNPSTGIFYSNLLISKASQDSLYDYIQYGYLQKGNNYKMKGDYTLALKAYIDCIKYAQKTDDKDINIGAASISIADIYSTLDNYENADQYYQQGIEILRQVNDSIKLATALLNSGEAYFKNKNYQKALTHFEESGKIFEKIDHPIGTAYNVGNVGMVYAMQGKDEEALEQFNMSLPVLEEAQQNYPISVYLLYMADIYAKKNQYRKALESANRSLSLAEGDGLKKEVSEANLKLSQLYEQSKEYEKAHRHYKNYVVYRDSINNLNTIASMADLKTNYEVSQKENELLQQKKLKNIIIIATAVALILLGLLAFGLFRRYNFIRRTNLIIEKERNLSDHLLRNILPAETAMELKDHGSVAAKRFESVTVLFTDFKGFTLHAEHLSPEELVKSVDYYFSKFDDIVGKYELEKIKTVGDAFMCAGGLPFVTTDHADKMILAAMEMLEFVEYAKTHNPDNQTRYDVRIGISSGPVVAGVVGKRKFAYDIWGDTVNVAARMESYSEAGKINISEETYHLIKDKYQCSYRGEMNVKNKGMMKMYFIEGLINEKEIITIEDKIKNDLVEPNKLIKIRA